MKTSATIELVWDFAGKEAVAAEFKEIEPDQFFMALLKFAELPVEAVGGGVEAAEIARALAAEVIAVREELKSRSIDGARVRHELRARLGNGGCPFRGGTLHRSSATKERFDLAARVAADAGSDTLMAVHLLIALLESPTPAMREVMGELPKLAGPSKTPLLDEHGQDLTAQAVEGTLPAVRDRGPESKALLRVLAGKEPKNVFLVCGSEQTARDVVMAAAHSVADDKAPSGSKLKRIVEFASLALQHRDEDNLFDNLLAEAASTREVILFLPGIGGLGGKARPAETWERLRRLLTKHPLQCICHVTSRMYEGLVKTQPEWKRLAEVISVRQTGAAEVPKEL